MKYFTIEELCKTKINYPNIPSEIEKNNLKYLTENVLDLVREKYGKPIHVDSGFRCEYVNNHVGGKSNSQHLHGQAADLNAGSKENKKIYDIIKSIGKYDQLINEYDFSWVHVSYINTGKNRKMEVVIK